VRGAATDQQLGAAGTRAATHASLAAQQVPVASRGAVAGTVKAAAAAAMKRQVGVQGGLRAELGGWQRLNVLLPAPSDQLINPA
jgi:hypothetical protein